MPMKNEAQKPGRYLKGHFTVLQLRELEFLQKMSQACLGKKEEKHPTYTFTGTLS